MVSVLELIYPVCHEDLRAIDCQPLRLDQGQRQSSHNKIHFRDLADLIYVAGSVQWPRIAGCWST